MIKIGNIVNNLGRKPFEFQLVCKKRNPISSGFRIQSVLRLIKFETLWLAHDLFIGAGVIRCHEPFLGRILHEDDGWRSVRDVLPLIEIGMLCHEGIKLFRTDLLPELFPRAEFFINLVGH